MFVSLLAGVRWTPLQICANNYNTTLGHNMFFDIYKLSTRIGNGGPPWWMILLKHLCFDVMKMVYTKLKHNIYYIKEYVGKQKDRKIAFSTLN